jgi:DNA-binding NarL/FixJ family response regulator
MTDLRVVVADDQDLVRGGFRMILEAHDIAVVGEAANGATAVHLVEQLRPDVILMDIRMPVVDGIAATRRIVASGSTTKVLVLTTYDTDEVVYQALAAGAVGFLLKTVAPDRLVESVRVASTGEALLAPELTGRLIQEYVSGPARLSGTPAAFAALTPRELEVARLIADGLTNAQIARRLVLGDATVKTHVNRILQKLGAHDRVQVVIQAYESGLVRPSGRA